MKFIVSDNTFLKCLTIPKNKQITVVVERNIDIELSFDFRLKLKIH